MAEMPKLFSRVAILVILLVCPAGAITFSLGSGTAATATSSTNVLNLDYSTGGVMQFRVTDPTMLGVVGFLFGNQVTINITNNTSQIMTGYRVELCLTTLCPAASTTADTGSLGDTLYTGSSLTWPTVQVTNGTADVRRFEGGSLVQSALGSVTFYVTINSYAVKDSFSLILNPEFAPNREQIPEPSTYAMIVIGAVPIIFAWLKERRPKTTTNGGDL